MMRRSNQLGGNRSGGMIRIIIALVVAAFALFSYFGSSEFNPITGETQRVGLSTDQEIALGLQSAPEMIRQFGGLLDDPSVQAGFDRLGQQLVQNSIAARTGWQFDFHVLADTNTVNAFALPGGQIFITEALRIRLETLDQIAGVVGHEIGHVLARHSAQRIAKSNLTQGLTGAVVVASGDTRTAQAAQVIGQIVNMQYGREDELESDLLGICIMVDSGYDPTEMIRVMEILNAASGGARQPEFLSTHPNPENRIGRIEETIQNIDTVCPRPEPR